MMEKRMKDMIHEALEGGGGIAQAKGHDQKLIVTLMSSKGHIGNVCLLHMYLVIAREKIKFSKELGATQFIQEVINEGLEVFRHRGCVDTERGVNQYQV
jgi:hypothetical protein